MHEWEKVNLTMPGVSQGRSLANKSETMSRPSVLVSERLIIVISGRRPAGRPGGETNILSRVLAGRS
jgi:hypothetical protein